MQEEISPLTVRSAILYNPGIKKCIDIIFCDCVDVLGPDASVNILKRVLREKFGMWETAKFNTRRQKHRIMIEDDGDDY